MTEQDGLYRMPDGSYSTQPGSQSQPGDPGGAGPSAPPQGVDPVAVAAIAIAAVSVLLGPFAIGLILPAAVLSVIAFARRRQRPGSRAGVVSVFVTVGAFVVWLSVTIVAARFLFGDGFTDQPPEAGTGTAGEAVIEEDGDRAVVPLDVCRSSGPDADDEHGYVLYAEPGDGRRLSVRDTGEVRVGLRNVFGNSTRTSFGTMRIEYAGSQVRVVTDRDGSADERGGRFDNLRIAATCAGLR